MSKEIIINADMAEEIRIAIIEKNRLADLDIEAQSRTKHKGNIYKGIVSNIEDSLDAAFIEFGEGKQAFLPLSEIRPELIPAELKGQKRVKISDVLERGQEVVVQVTKDEIGNKGAAVSTYLSLPGRYVVLMHSDDSGGGISRKIENESARQAARDMLSRLNVPEGMAVIIRTAGMTATRQDLYRDFRALCEIWQQINKGAQLGRAPTLLYREPDIVVRTIRDYFSSEVTKVVIDVEEYEDALRYFTDHMPDLVKVLERHKKKEPIFLHYGIEQAIEELFERQVKLHSGGYIVIEQTEALVSIDVNSGRSTKEEGHAATVYKTNLEACDELARQLRLRDLGGIVVVDFIDMVSSKHKRDVEKRLKEAMRADKARIKLGRIGENGTLELTRQRLRQSHHLISHVSCSHCKGTGRVRDAEGLAIMALRRISGQLSKRRVQLASLTVRLPVEVANVLNNQKRRELVELSDVHELNINIVGDARYVESSIEFEEERRGQAGLDAAAHNKDYKSEIMSARPQHQKGGGRQQQEKWAQQPRKNTPPPSIGPVPTLMEFDETEDDMPQAESAEKRVIVKHYDDPLMEAFFGSAPEMDVSHLIQSNARDESNDEDDDSNEDSAKPRAEGEEQRQGQGESEGTRPPRNRRKRFSRSRHGRRFNNPNSDNKEPSNAGPVALNPASGE
jgi:ribonuclease E